ncbi:MAG: pyridoxamine 5'-phosphate oxidase family protein [Pseudomonadota bacterium]
MNHETQQEERSKLYEMINEVRLAMLTTIEKNGSLHTRPMANHEIDKNGDIWFFTSKDSTIAANISANPHVSLGYSSPEDGNYVAITGNAYLVDDHEIIVQKWTSDVQAWFPQGVNDPDIVLVRVHPINGQFWDTLTTTIGYSQQPASLSGIDRTKGLEQVNVHR